MLVLIFDVEALELDGGAVALKNRIHTTLGEMAAQLDGEQIDGGVAAKQGAFGMEVVDAATPALHANVAQGGVALHDDLGDAAAKALACRVGGGEVFDECDVGVRLEDDERVREAGGAVQTGADDGTERELDADAAGHVEEGAVVPEGAM